MRNAYDINRNHSIVSLRLLHFALVSAGNERGQSERIRCISINLLLNLRTSYSDRAFPGCFYETLSFENRLMCLMAHIMDHDEMQYLAWDHSFILAKVLGALCITRVIFISAPCDLHPAGPYLSCGSDQTQPES